MALTLVSILTLANVALAVPVVQRDVACKATYYSEANDTCQSIGLAWGYYDTDILAANTFLNCDDICKLIPLHRPCSTLTILKRGRNSDLHPRHPHPCHRNILYSGPFANPSLLPDLY
jgi:hypothetical protein